MSAVPYEEDWTGAEAPFLLLRTAEAVP